MLKGFRDFIARGNVIDLAVAVVIGSAFALVIKAFLDGLINPLIAAIFGKPSLNDVGVFEINDAVFSVGLVLTAILNFVIVAAAIYFIVIVPMNVMVERARKGKDTEPDAQSDEVILLTEIRDALRQRS